VLPQDFEDTHTVVGACEAAVQLKELSVVQKSGAKDESSRSGTLTFNRTHASERGAAARKSRFGSRIARDEKFVAVRHLPHAASPRARVAVPALAAGLLLVPHEDAYQCVRTCPGAR
jgi:hypothetical protein